jgi:hypothetical protein
VRGAVAARAATARSGVTRLPAISHDPTRKPLPRILIRSHKSPFAVVDAETTVARNTIGANTGNLVFSQAVYRLLSTHDADLQASGLANSRPRSVNARFDHVVVPLANAFRPAYVQSLHGLSAVIENLTVPVTVVGVGAQASLEGARRATDAVGEATKRFVSAVLDRSPSIGVRGEFTRDFLRSLGFGDEHVRVIGCPSMFMYGPDLRIERKVESVTHESPIAFNISPYVKATGPMSLRLAAEYPNLVYMAQNVQTLELMLYGEYPGNKGAMVKAGAPVTLQHPLIRQNRVRFFLDPKTWFEHLATYDFSFGTRIHGNIASLLGGTPAVLLAHDARTLELAEYHHIPYRLITSVSETADPITLYGEADWEPLNQAHPARWQTFAAFLAEHGLTTVYDEGQDARRFDEQYEATAYPPPVETLMGWPPEQLYEMKRTLRRLQEERGRPAGPVTSGTTSATSTISATSLSPRAPLPSDTPAARARAAIARRLPDRVLKRIRKAARRLR